MNDKPVWRTILSVAVCLLAVIRLAITCSKSSDRSSYSDTSYQNTNSIFERYGNNSKDIQGNDSKSNDLFYENYDSISKLNDAQKAIFRVVGVKNDTLVPLTITSKINIESKSFVQKNHDDSLQLAVKLPDNTTMFLHNYDSKDDMVNNFKTIKKKRNIENLDIIMDEPDSKFLSYTYKYLGKKYNGFALLAREKDQFTSLEFENDRISKKDLREKAANFILQVAK